MMPKRDDIAAALASLATGNLPTAAKALFGVLGYRSERVLEGQSGSVEGFIEQSSEKTKGISKTTESEKRFRENATAVYILFQVTNDEVINSGQGTLKEFHEDINESYLFLTVELNQANYARSQYAELTREVNKRFPMPAFLLFRTGRGEQSKITLAFVQRRKHKRDGQRHVLGSVSLIRDIDPHQPHRAHLDILAELSLPERMEWMASHNKPANFDGLLAALLNTLDTQKLNKRFYKDLFGWFNGAVKDAKIPTNQARMIPKEEHIIRLITRLLFVWFIKEKGLVAEELFIEERVRSLLKNYDLVRGDSYYRAVLQNLFFATLNTEIHKRGFSTTTQRTHRDFSRYRYKDEMADPESLLKLFEKTPFINGGLFDCLDSFDATGTGGYRIDCFSDNLDHRKLLSIPNHLFFAKSDKAAGSSLKVDGLVTIFNRYKFTVEENTPVEQDVALDPELLGKVFENLLAAVNPSNTRKTKESARKATGSYYTPRLVVDYMVDEVLVASLATKVYPADGDGKFLRDRLHYLLDYEDAFDDAKDLFEDGEAQQIVQAIAEIKVLDPAVGSGAFPMGILHKLTLALQRLDPDNTQWEDLQKHMAQTRAAAAFDTSDQQNRDKELDDISATFEHYRNPDFGRKLYLIQNSIFGVDIQTIACQIAKLRFFISLAIEQYPNHNPGDNYGIKPLPNLETRFVAANTLLALAGGGQRVIPSPHTQELEQQLRANRERYFHAKTRDLKLQCQREDRRLRGHLTTELKTIGMEKVDAEKIAAWDPYDQNASTDWFDAGYMFGVGDGFDVVIGNPPYVRQEEIGPSKPILLQQYANAVNARSDLYCYFYARGLQLLCNGGMHVFICSNSWLDVGYGAKLQDYLLKHAHIQAIYESALERQFTTADINTIITVIQKTNSIDNSDVTCFVSLRSELETALSNFTKRQEIWKSRAELRAAGTNDNKFCGDKWGGKYLRAPDIYHHILENYADKLVRLGDIATVRFGIKTGANDFFFLTPERIAEFGIEAEYLAPIMTTPQESRSIIVNPAALPNRLFVCHINKAELTGTGALNYIEYGETFGYHRRSSCKSRRRWYDLGKRNTAKLAINYVIDTTARTYYLERGCLVPNVFHTAQSKNSEFPRLCSTLNSTFSQLIINLSGRANLGGGALKLELFEFKGLQIVSPELLPEPDINVFSSADWDVLTPSPARQEIDTAVFDALGLSSGEREAVCEGVVDLVENRKKRARSV